MKTIQKILAWHKGLRTRDKILTCASMIMTIAIMAAVPAFAWFTYNKNMATMAKIDSPAKLSIKAGDGEDIINFKMSGIDIRDGSPQDFVFCVEGDDISRYNLQLAHTTNINFTYHIYQAKETESTAGIQYVRSSDSEPVYYQKIGEAIPMSAVNGTDDTFSTRKLGNTQYDKQSYENGENRQKFAEPLYWQTNTAIVANSESQDYDELNEDESAFRNYYVLEVSWGADVTNDKETDMIYLTAEVAQ